MGPIGAAGPFFYGVDKTELHLNGWSRAARFNPLARRHALQCQILECRRYKHDVDSGSAVERLGSSTRRPRAKAAISQPLCSENRTDYKL